LGVENRIVSFDGHVIVEYQAANDEWYLADPDFGVLLGSNLQQLAASPQSSARGAGDIVFQGTTTVRDWKVKRIMH
jgi:hypothetical protein